MKLKNRRVFITGGAGFIGSNIVRKLLIEGAIVRIYDNFSSGSEKNLKGIIDKIDIVKGDILNKPLLINSMKGSEIISHHAAQLEITKAIKDPTLDLNINTTGTINILEGCVTHGIKKLINASSACVYGQKAKVPSHETDSLNPNWAYGISKLAAEKYCQIYSDMYGISVISFRYAIIYGENEWFGRVMTIFLKRAHQNLPLIIFGDGLQRRDFTHVSDVVDSNIKAMNLKNNTHEVINVSTGVGTTIKQLAFLIKKNIQSNTSVIFDKEVTPGTKSTYIDRMRLPQELQNMILSNDKLKKVLGITPKIDLNEGIKRQITWSGNNLSHWKVMSY